MLRDFEDQSMVQDVPPPIIEKGETTDQNNTNPEPPKENDPV